ncbi:MAG TPA: hypothetical protein VF017_22500 [Thermoanaerobaculia bacterium]|nr:hypothetical protein [Thermoanaerobaculia bacterium]
MSHPVATACVVALEVYLLLGLVFALAFVRWGASRLDPAAREASWGFRLLILPASAALWPWLALRWWRARQEVSR